MNQPADIRKPKRKPEPIYFKIDRGCLVPADAYAQSQLRNKKFKIGDVIKADIRKLRSNRFNRLVHRIGQLCAENIDEFSGMDSHRIIKRIQLEGNIYCDEHALKIHGFEAHVWKYIKPVVEPILTMVGFKINDDGFIVMRVPISLSFDSLDESEFRDAAKQVCRWIAAKYWHGLDPDQIEEMAGAMVDE